MSNPPGLIVLSPPTPLAAPAKTYCYQRGVFRHDAYRSEHTSGDAQSLAPHCNGHSIHRCSSNALGRSCRLDRCTKLGRGILQKNVRLRRFKEWKEWKRHHWNLARHNVDGKTIPTDSRRAKH